MKQFEYCIEFLPEETNNKEDKLNYLGSEGWELCCGLGGDEDPMDTKFFIFKRQKCS